MNELGNSWIAPDATAIPSPVLSTALARPEHIVLVTDEGEWSATQLARDVATTAGGLLERGVAASMRVALIGPSCAAWVVAWHAIGWTGASVVPLSAEQPEAELERALALTRPLYAVVLPGTAELTRRRLAASGVTVIELDKLPLSRPAPERFWPWEEERAVVLTSGTTGTPRAVAISTRQWVLSAFASAIRLGHALDDRWLNCLPLHHVGGLSILMRCALYGTTVVLHARFVAARVARLLDTGKVTLTSMVPTMLERVLEVRPQEPFPATLRCILLGGAAAPTELLDRCRAAGLPVAVTWGMSEAASQVATRFAGDLTVDGGVGAPLAFARVRKRGEVLEVAGPLVSGSLATSDRGYVDDLGRVHIEGRDDGAIVSGGEKIDPVEVERVLTSHPSVREAAVLGVPDARWGERPAAMLVAREGATRPSDAALAAHCRQRLAAYKIPDSWIWVERLTTSELDKRSRRALRADLEARAPELFAKHTKGAQALQEVGGDLERSPARAVDEGVHELGGGAHVTRLAHQRIAEGDRARAHAGHLDLHRDSLAEADGALVVGLGMHEGRAPAVGAERRLRAAKHAGQKLFKGLMAVLKHVPEKDDAEAVDLAEPRRDLVLEAQGRTPKEE